ncbi:AlpA family phage regulatory protein [bacterium]|nr:AlpA family phage regulatory protein [bacterium]
MKELRQLLPVSKVTIYNLMRERGFPKQIKLSPTLVVWRESEVREWIEAQAVDEAA